MRSDFILNKLRQIPNTISTFLKEATNCKSKNTNFREKKHCPVNVNIYKYSHSQKSEDMLLLKGKANVLVEQEDQLLMKTVIFSIIVYGQQKNVSNYYDILVLKTIFNTFLHGNKKEKINLTKINNTNLLKTYHQEACKGYIKYIDFPGIHANLKIIDKFTGKIQKQGIRAKIIN